MRLDALPEELVLSFLLQLRDMRTILRVEVTCTMICRLVKQYRASLFRTTYVSVYGCWRSGQMRHQPRTDAAKELMDACYRRRGEYTDSEQRAAAARIAITKGAHVNALYQVPMAVLNGRMTSHGVSPLRMAALSCLVPVVRELLLAGADVNMTSDDGKMPLVFLWVPWPNLERDGVAIVDMLMRAGASEQQRVAAIDKINAMRRAYLAPLLCALEACVGTS